MAEETDEVVGPLSRELVSGLAPEELPLFPSLLSQFQGTERGRGGQKSSNDQVLGFGGGEALTILTPVILSFTQAFLLAVLAETTLGSAHSVLDYIRAHFAGGHEAAAVPPLTPDQLQLVRTVAEREARRLDVPKDQVGLLANAMIGALAVPEAS
jgi:hypothetical protein